MDDEDLLSHSLTGEGIRNYPQDLRELSAEELRGLFAFTSSGKINATRVIKNLIWQAYTAIRGGRRPPIAGNLRSFWYTDVKPVLARLGVPVEGRRATELVYDAFVEMAYTMYVDQRLSVADICQTLRISQAAFYRYVALGRRAAEGLG